MPYNVEVTTLGGMPYVQMEFDLGVDLDTLPCCDSAMKE